MSVKAQRPQLEDGWRVGVYGGSFDPVHTGHVEPVLAVMEEGLLDHVLFLPTAFPPHKRGQDQAPADLRFAMVQLALEGVANATLIDDEMSDAPTYSVETLERLSAEFPKVEFSLIVGADSYCDLPKWKRWQDIVAGWDIVVLPRPGWSVDASCLPEEKTLPEELISMLNANPHRQHIVLEEPLIEASSTEIRRCVRSDQPVPEGWLLDPVLDFIQVRQLYRGNAETTEEPPVNSTDPIESDTGLTANTSSPEAATESTTGAAQPEAEKPATTIPLPTEVALAAYTALDRQAIDLVLLEVTEVCDFADYFIVCSGNTDRQVAAIADAVQRALRKAKVKPLHVEGQRRGNWVLVDYGHLIVHIFDPATRDFYRLERLWDDAPRVPESLYSRAPEAVSKEALLSATAEEE